ncbi:MAG: ATP-binding protein [Planctomycetota bacterium]
MASAPDDRQRRKGRLAFLGALAGGLAHEIKNPLSAMTVHLSMIREDLANATTPRETRTLRRVQLLEKEVARLEEILNDFLRFARGFKLEPVPLSVTSVVEDVVDFLEPEMRSRGIRLRLQTASDLPLVALDCNYFQQALLNIFVNAQDALESRSDGEVLVRVWQGTEGGKPTVEISITDTGPGIPPEYLPRIFDAYFTTKKGGTGMGLPTARRIVEEHNGSIEVKSELGKGTRFLIRLPAYDAAGSAAEAEEGTTH